MVVKSVRVESEQRFSESKLWAVQREYYDSQGIDAWAEQVPFYVTSNPVIADQYAKITVRFMQEWQRRHPLAKDNVFYMVELGTGTGQFSYYMLKRITELLDAWSLGSISFCYIMTDFTSSNIDFWKTQPALTPFVERGVLDFALFDIEKDKEIKLCHSAVTLQPGSVVNPLTVYANYLFDSVVVDAFRVDDGSIKEALVSIDIPRSMEATLDWSKANLTYTHKAIGRSYYSNPYFDAILKEYSEQLTNSNLQFPVGSLRGLENLAALSSEKLFLLSSDKGYVEMAELENLEQPDIAFHGSFSLMANYHAIAKYFELRGGAVCLQDTFDRFASGAFSLGFSMAEMPLLQATLDGTFKSFAPGHYFHWYDHFDDHIAQASLEAIAALLTYSHWDPAIFDLAATRISELMDEADVDVVDYLSRHLPEVANQFYFVPGCHDSLFNVAVFFQEQEEYEKSIPFYMRSIRFFGESYATLFNIAFCYYYCENYKKSYEFFQQAQSTEHNKQDRKELALWLKKVSQRLQHDDQ